MGEQVETQDITSAPQPETSTTYSKEHVDKLMEKVRSDTLAEMGRVRKAAEEAVKKATDAANNRVSQLLKEQEDAQMEAARDNPEAINLIRERQTRRQKEADLTKAQTELEIANAKLQELSAKETETVKNQAVGEVANRFKVDPAKLAKMAKYTDGSVAAIEEIAKELPRVNPAPRNNLRPDNNESLGGTPRSVTEIRQAYIKGEYRGNIEAYEKDLKAVGARP